jgi:hypothetical protein
MRPFPTGPNAVYLLTFGTDECTYLRTTKASHAFDQFVYVFKKINAHLLLHISIVQCNNILAGASFFTALLQEVLGLETPDGRLIGV